MQLEKSPAEEDMALAAMSSVILPLESTALGTAVEDPEAFEPDV